METRGYTSPLREEAAARTRERVLRAAAELFAEGGYARTSVAAIARAAGVAVNTVYTSVGGKSALLLAMVDDRVADEAVRATTAALTSATSAAEVLRLVARGTSVTRDRRELTLSVLLDNRDAHPDVAEAARVAEAEVRARFAEAADRMLELGGLREGVGGEELRRALWFYFGFPAWRVVRAEGLSWDDGAAWLCGQASDSLLAR
ncbi:TetR/AcrR family transcriptional regulator [Actinosynnema sp.]|uniref:TetR/AcrR family transcriptional regulator n=1 Tax=Actinosynnema sp. TaxID=1872144 RepID=UPI003F84D042